MTREDLILAAVAGLVLAFIIGVHIVVIYLDLPVQIDSGNYIMP